MIRLGIESGLILKYPFIVHDTSIEMTAIQGKGVIELERKTKTLMISAVVVLAVLSGIAAMAYANGLNDASTESNVACDYSGYYNDTRPFFGRQRWGWGHGGSITVSQEFKDNVINITKSDSDVQKLLADGYDITDVRPIINTVVEADGTVTMKATSAIVTLYQDTTGRAFAWVDVEQGKVTKIVISTRTVIEKP
jgi:hypothetical protein